MRGRVLLRNQLNAPIWFRHASSDSTRSRVRRLGGRAPTSCYRPAWLALILLLLLGCPLSLFLLLPSLLLSLFVVLDQLLLLQAGCLDSMNYILTPQKEKESFRAVMCIDTLKAAYLDRLDGKDVSGLVAVDEVDSEGPKVERSEDMDSVDLDEVLIADSEVGGEA